MKRKLILLLLSLCVLGQAADQETDTDRLSRAVSYFQGGKYHEAMILFEQLSAKYKLNPRFNGFLGLCYYHEWQYEEAAAILDKTMEKLEVFAPSERAVYYFTCGDSHFKQEEYAAAIRYFEKALTVCYENEKPEIYYKLAYSHLRLNDVEQANALFAEAEDYYSLYHTTPQLAARIGKMQDIVDDTERELAIMNLPKEEPILRDTLHFEAPKTINLDDIFGSGIEIDEEE